MIYLIVAHADDENCDLFRFSTLDRAVKYIIEEHLTEWILSDFPNQYMENDYTYIES